MNAVHEVHGEPNLNFIQFGNLPDDPFLIRNVIVNIHSHTDIGVSHHILNHLDIQICLRHTGTCGMPQDVSRNMRHLLRLSFFPLRPFLFLLIVVLYNIPQDEIDGAWHHGTSDSAHEDKIRKAVDFNITRDSELEIYPALGLKGFPDHLAHRDHPNPGLCLRQSLMEVTAVPIIFIGQLVIYGNGPFFISVGPKELFVVVNMTASVQ